MSGERPPLRAQPGVTALVGEVRTLHDEPLQGVTLRIGDRSAKTDNTGHFLLTSIPPGHQVLMIDGRAVNAPDRTYGVFEAGIDVREARTNILPFTVWMPEIDTGSAMPIPSPTTGEIVVTNPALPGLELHLPPGTTIRGNDGQVVDRISLTPIPRDRPPFPLPLGADFTMYFTVQPADARIEPHGARLLYPNVTDELPSTRANFWSYDPKVHGWHIYGKGTVSPDGKQVVPDASVYVHDFAGASITPFGNGPPPGSHDDYGGDPVNLATGLFVLTETNIILGDTLPIAAKRSYRPASPLEGLTPFGVGSSHIYEWFLLPDMTYTEVDLVLPDGGRVHFNRTSPGTGPQDAVFQHSATPSAFFRSRLTLGTKDWELTLKNGTVYSFRGTANGGASLLLGIRDRHGNSTTIVRRHGEHGKATQVISPNGRWIEFAVDATTRNVVQIRDSIGRSAGYTYNDLGLLTKVKDVMGGETEYTYDPRNLLQTIKDARGIVYVTNEYSPPLSQATRVLKQTQADGSTYRFAYALDGNGKIIQTDVTDAGGNTRRVTFNADGYILTDTRALGTLEEQTVTYERQSSTNLVLGVTDPLGRKTTYTYDGLGNVTSLTRVAGTPDAVTSSFAYEPRFNQLARLTNPLGHTTFFHYDDDGNLTAITDPLGNSTTVVHNAEGQAISITDPLGHITRLAYERGDLVTVTDSLGASASRAFDSAGRPVSTTDRRGQVTSTIFDAHNRLTQVIDPTGGITAFAYDANGNLLSVTDARGSVTKYTYDDMDRLVSRTDPLGRTETYEYDAAGNLTRFTDRKEQATRFSYDTLNHLTQVKYADDSAISCAYDAGNRLTQVTDSISGTITFTYDDLDRPTVVSTPQGKLSYTYDAAGRRTSMTVAGQSPVTYTYDDADRLTEISQGAAAVTIAYDAAGRPTSLTLPGDVVIEYGYDAAAQLHAITYKRAGTITGNLTYEYDAAGNRAHMSGSFARITVPKPVSSLVYDAANQLTQQEATSLTYDANGNLISDGINSYSWDARDRLTSIIGPGLAATFQYDAFDRRIGKIVNGTATEFMYDHLNVVQELSGGTPVTNVLTGLEIDEYFIRKGADGLQILLFDALGSTLALLDASGAIQTEYTYEPFGATTSRGFTATNAFQYTGRENDGTGLYHYRARYYSPALRRFISEDPLGFAGKDINLYAYALCSPANFRDPLGLSSDLEAHIAIRDGAPQNRDVYYDPSADTWEERNTSGRKDRDGAEGIEKGVRDLNRGIADMIENVTAMAGVGIGAVRRPKLPGEWGRISTTGRIPRRGFKGFLRDLIAREPPPHPPMPRPLGKPAWALKRLRTGVEDRYLISRHGGRYPGFIISLIANDP